MKRDQRAYVGRTFQEYVCRELRIDLVDVAELSFGVGPNDGKPFVIVYGTDHGVLGVLDLATAGVRAGEVKAGTKR